MFNNKLIFKINHLNQILIKKNINLAHYLLGIKIFKSKIENIKEKILYLPNKKIFKNCFFNYKIKINQTIKIPITIKLMTVINFNGSSPE